MYLFKIYSEQSNPTLVKFPTEKPDHYFAIGQFVTLMFNFQPIEMETSSVNRQ